MLRSRVHTRLFERSLPSAVHRRFISSSQREARIERIFSRLPKFIQPYASGLKTAPLSHIASFLVLHELTAVLPLVGLSLSFYYTDWLPNLQSEGRWINEGIEKFGNYFARKGWFGFREIDGEEAVENRNPRNKMSHENLMEASHKIERTWRMGMNGGTLLIQVATAYAITKVLLPVRIFLSIWCTPWFARTILGKSKRFFFKG